MPDTKMYWMGRDIDTLTREELIDVVRCMKRETEDARACTRSIIEINDLARKARTALDRQFGT